jgi:hypothetical protein
MLQDYLDREFSWRLKELANLKLAVRRTDALQEKTLVRAAVPLLYAHWEGFIKNATVAYVNFVHCQGLRYDQLASCFVTFGVKRHLRELSTSRQAASNIAAVEFLITRLGQRADLTLSKVVDTESNLSSTVFENIAVSVGLPTAAYRPRYNLIDESLLKRRNKIAHGEYLDLNATDCRQLIDEVITLLRAYKNDIEITAGDGAYLRNLLGKMLTGVP